MQAIILVVILSVISHSVQAEEKLCGRNLSITLAALCRAQREKELRQYASQKRSQYNSILPYYEPYWLEPESALRLRGKRDEGIVEECCLKACSIDELTAYCPPLEDFKN